MKDGILYKVTTDIAKGDALTVETNIVLDTVASELSEISERLLEYKVKEYTFKYTKTSQWMSYNIEESNAFLDGPSYLDSTDKVRYPLNYSGGTYCQITYKDDAKKIYFWSKFAGTVHAFIHYK